MTSKYLQVKGLKAITANLNKAIADMEANAMKGLIESVIMVRRTMDKEEPTIPVQFNNLRASWTVQPMSEQKAVKAGFSANYAAYVHENMEPDVEWTRKGSGPKFFEKALLKNKKEILKTVAKETKV